ncbi:MAG: hypothetical protein AAGG50_15785, partial [Bacteroidota bacterium]
LVTDPRSARPHRVTLLDSAAVVDSTGNPGQGGSVFTPSSAPDTVQARVAAFLPPGVEGDTLRTLRPDQRPGLRFTRPPDSTLPARLQFNPVTLALTDIGPDGVSYRTGSLPESGSVSISAPWADSVRTMRFSIPTASDLGELTGTVVRDTSHATAPLLVELYTEDASERLAVTIAAADGTFRFDQLPEGSYRLRLIVDVNGDGDWTGGRLAPYEAPEPLDLVEATERVRPRWETAMDTLRFGVQPVPPRAAEAAPPPTSDG